MRQVHRYCSLVVLAILTVLINGCGGSGGTGSTSAGHAETTTNTNVGGMAVSYRSATALKPVTAGGAPVVVTGLGGGTITNLTFTPVPVLPQTAIVYNEGGEVTAYSLLTAASAPLTSLTPNASTTSPSFSHDGRIVFNGVYSGKQTLLQMYADGSGLSGVTTPAGGGAKPAFSPLNNMIAYTMAGALKICQTNGTVIASAQTSFGGVQGIILLATGGTLGITFNGQTASVPYNASSGQIQTALNGLSSIGGVGGSVVVTQRLSGQSTVYTIIFAGTLAGLNLPAITLNTSNLTNAEQGSAFESTAQLFSERPAWSPDGSKIVEEVVMSLNYNAYTEPGYAIFGTNGVMKSFIPEVSYEGLGSVAWSPDGNKLVFSADSAGFFDIIGHDLASGAEWVIDNAMATGGADIDPTVSPDDKTVAFVKQTSPPAIWTASISGANPTILIKSVTGALDHPDWQPFPAKKTFVGSGGEFGTSTSGFLLGQGANGFGGLLVFTAATPSSATVTAQGIVGTAFLVKADNITSMSYANVYYGAPVSVIPGAQAATSQALVLFSLLTGKVTGVATLGPKAPVTVTRQGNTVTYSGRFERVWNASGQIVATGATRIDADASGEKPRVR